MLPEAQSYIGPALGRYLGKEGRASGFRKAGDMCRLTKTAPCVWHFDIVDAPALKRCRDGGGNLGVLVHDISRMRGLSQTKKLAPVTPVASCLSRNLQPRPFRGRGLQGAARECALLMLGT